MPKGDPGIESLLLLDGEIYDQGDGYWINIEARQVEPDEHVPHGIRYALALHDRYGTRLLGYDSAHAVKPPMRKRYPVVGSPTITSIAIAVTRAWPMNSPAPISC